MIGAEFDNSPNLDMDVATVLVYDRALSEVERQQVEAYLQQRYFGQVMVVLVVLVVQTSCRLPMPTATR